MKNNSNIYDIDGELIRRFDDVHHFTALEATKIHEKYLKKIQDLRAKEVKTSEDEKKLRVYEIYCSNLQHYISAELQKMDEKELNEYYKTIIPEKPSETTQEDVEKALNDLKDDIATAGNIEDKIQESTARDSKDNTDSIFGDDPIVRREPCDVPEERSDTQDDLLVERDNVNTVMDEYVQFEELPDSDESSK